MDLNTKGIFISIFQLAEKGGLSKLQQKDVINALWSFGMYKLNQGNYDIDSDSNIDEDFKKIRIGTLKLLEQTEQCIDTALEMLKKHEEYYRKFKIDLKNLPKFAELEDTLETLNLIKSLDKDLYNFSEAEKLTGVTRQTLKKHAKIGKDGLRIFQSGKSDYLTREGLLSYFRAKTKDNSLPF